MASFLPLFPLLLLPLLGLSGCQPGEDDDDAADDDATADDDTTAADDDSTASDDDTSSGCTDTASGAFPEGTQEIAYDNGTGELDITAYEGSVYEGYYGAWDVAETSQWEAVRFDLDTPAIVYGARVQWTSLKGAGLREVPLGAFPDFGSNGFDFDQWNPLWEGSRCLEPESGEGTWVDYVFDTPIEVPLPGLFYIAHWKEDVEQDPLWWMDGDYAGDGSCALYDDCHSAWNYPEMDAEVYYNGLSFSAPYDYLVRLVVEKQDTIPAEKKSFQVDPALSVGGRVSIGDYNNDGWEDVMTDGPTLYRNEGDGTFSNVSTEAGLVGLVGYAGGGAWGDYDNDGCLDYYGFHNGYVGVDVLLHNRCDGTFEDLNAVSGLDDTQYEVDCDPVAEVEQAPTEGAAWVDLDADGWLDLYVGNHNCWTTYQFYQDRIWHNQGDGTFLEWGSEHGFTTQNLPTRGVSPVDSDRDGDMDIATSSYVLERNLFYLNLGDGQFEEIGRDNNLAGTGDFAGIGTYYYGHTIGSTWFDLENDGDWDLFQGNLAHPRFYDFSDRTMVMENDGSGMFTNVAEEAGIHYRETHSSPSALDYNSDGFTDIFITCVYDGRFSELYHNNGDGTFTQVNYPTGLVNHNGWGNASADLDNDGDVDVLAYQYFRNDTGALGQHWLEVRPWGGTVANRSAIGAQVEVILPSGVHLLRQVDGGHGTGCQDSAVLHFGLGDEDQVEGVVVRYPGGWEVTVSGPVAADQRIHVQDDGTITFGWVP